MTHPSKSKSGEGRYGKNGGVNGRDGCAERLVRCRLQWAGHVERMAGDRLMKRAAELREQDRRRRGRPRRLYLLYLSSVKVSSCRCS